MTIVRKVNKDVVGGALMFVCGISVALHSTSFNIGSLSRMGPGFFPLALGIILAVVGITLAAKGYHSASVDSDVRQEKSQLAPEWKAWTLICLGIVAFVISAKYLGLVVATFAVVFISALGDRENTWRSAALLGAAMVVVAVVVFWWALKIQMPLFRWGFA
ncbi:tripartite tricarboxylate transporter TctB family protein [Paraburkholderia sp. JHI869]|uniref:tripartite tricarboxylate transporter TctB family protein n=1 Tax=Paraburkholderia sp. JHI869 TaxID=3112959 RepID=UPI00317F91C1